MTIEALPAATVTDLVVPDPRQDPGTPDVVATHETTVPSIAYRLAQPLLGFPGLLDFAVSPIQPDSELLLFKSLENPTVGFVVAPPGRFFLDYTPTVSEDLVRDLGFSLDSVLDCMVILNLGDTWEDSTANLKAPLLFDHSRGIAAQILTEDDWPIKAPLTA